MSCWIKDDEVWKKYEEIWDKIENKLITKFHSKSVYDKKYIKTKVTVLTVLVKTNFLGDRVPKENMHYTCLACITIDSVMKMEKKNYLQVYLEECKYKRKRTKTIKFIEAELESDSESDSEAELKSDTELTEADSGLVKLVGMTNVFFNNQQHEIKTKQFICVKQIKSSFFSNNGNLHFYS